MSNYAETFRALGSPHRLEIFKRVLACCDSGCTCGDVELCVSKLAEGLNISKATVSHHVKALADAGLITLTKSGREVYCQVRKDTLKGMIQLLQG